MIAWLGIGLGIAAASFAVLWAICVRVKNYSFLDAAWSYGVAVLAPIYAWAGPGHPGRKLAFTVLGAAWSLRLGTYILLRVLRHHPAEDVRYAALRQRWPGPGLFLLFFELQALTVVVFSIPFLLAAWRTTPLRGFDLAGLALAALALAGESLADRQMNRFKARERSGRSPSGEGGAAQRAAASVCQEGLWRYSRHPNYFFEFLFWCGVCLASLGQPRGWITLACPALIYYFLARVTGIPLTEEYAVKSKGDAYRDYQRTTSAFVPWFRRD